MTTSTTLVCATCGKPVERTFDDDFQHESTADGVACTAWPVRPVRASLPECCRCGEPITGTPVADPEDPLRRRFCSEEHRDASAEAWHEQHYRAR